MTATIHNPIILVTGSDEAAVKKEAAALAQHLMPEHPMNLEVIDGRADSVDDAVRSIHRVREAILTLPFFGGGKLVWWKAVNFLEESGFGRFASVKEALEEFQPNLDIIDGTSVRLLLSAEGLHKGRSFSRALLKRAEAKTFDLPDLRKLSEDDIIYMIENRMRAAGIRPGTGAAERFYQATGLNTLVWEHELEKLSLYAGEGNKELSRDEVDQIISGTRDVLIWDFCSAVLEGNGKLALGQLGALLAQEESEVGILIILSNQVRLAALGAVLKENKLLRLTSRGNFSNAEVLAGGERYLPRKKSGDPISTYQLGQAAQRSHRQPALFWLRAVDLLYRTLKEMLTGQGDKRRLLELAVLEIVAS